MDKLMQCDRCKRLVPESDLVEVPTNQSGVMALFKDSNFGAMIKDKKVVCKQCVADINAKSKK